MSNSRALSVDKTPLQMSLTAHLCTLLLQFGKVVYYDTSDQRTNERNPYYTAAYNAVEVCCLAVHHASACH